MLIQRDPGMGVGPRRIRAGALNIIKKSLAVSFHWRPGGLRQGLFCLVYSTSTAGSTAHCVCLRPELSTRMCGAVACCSVQALLDTFPLLHHLVTSSDQGCGAPTHTHTLDVTSPFLHRVPTLSMASMMLCCTCMLPWGS